MFPFLTRRCNYTSMKSLVPMFMILTGSIIITFISLFIVNEPERTHKTFMDTFTIMPIFLTSSVVVTLLTFWVKYLSFGTRRT